MRELQITKTWPIVLSQTCLFIFIQKFLYGYGVPVHNDVLLFGGFAYSYFTLLQVAMIFVVCIAVPVTHTSLGRRSISSRTVIAFGALAVPAEAFILFAPYGAFSPLHEGLLCAATLTICLSFCILGIAWFRRIRFLASSLGSTAIMLASGLGAFVYCLLTPADGNTSLYTMALESLALPCAAALLLVRPPVSVESTTSYSRKFEKRGVPVVVGLLFFVVLAITYMDYLNENYPAIHLEQPTFYACLLVAIAAVVVGFYFVDKERVSSASKKRIGLSLACLSAFLFMALYLIVAFYSAASLEFCFQFTCTARRFAIAFFYLVIIKLMISDIASPETGFGPLLVVPVLGTRAIMGSIWLQVVHSSFVITSDLRASALLVLGLALTALLTGLSYSTQYALLTSRSTELSTNNTSTPQQQRGFAVDTLSFRFGLSDRESEILLFLSMGYSTARIAKQLFIAPNTVGTHVRSIYKKIGIHSKQEAIDVVTDAMVSKDC